MYVQYYNSLTGRQESAFEIKRSTGLDFKTSGPEALSRSGIFPIAKVNQPFNLALYDVAISWDTSTGKAVKSWTATARTLADVIDEAKKQLATSASGRIAMLRQASELPIGVLRAADGIDDSIRPARFDKWVDRISAIVSTLDTQLTSIEGAATVDAINNLVSPAHGVVNLALDYANPLNLLAGDFKTLLSKDYAASDLELYFPSTDTTLAYSSGFAATSSVVTEDDPTVQIRVTSTGVVVDELFLSAQDSSLPIPNIVFGYRKHAVESRRRNLPEHLQKQRSYAYYDTDPKVFTVTVSGSVFHIDGVAQKTLALTQGESYRFDQSDASNSGHPLRIYTDEEKSTEVFSHVVLVGTPGTAGAYTEFIPASDEDVYYQCENHDLMGGYLPMNDVYEEYGDKVNTSSSSGSGGY